MVKIVILVLTFLFSFPLYASDKITVMCTKGVIDGYGKYLEEKGGDPLQITEFSSPIAYRAIIDLVLMKQALHRGGLDLEFELIASPNAARGVHEVKQGRAVLYQADIWEDVFDETVYKSDAVIPSNQFQKGLFVPESSPFLQETVHLDTLRNTQVLIVESWELDKDALLNAGFKNIVTRPRYEDIPLLVCKGRYPMTFSEFKNTEHMIIRTKYCDLHPIHDIKIVFQESRHFIVSRVHPLGEKVFIALQKGLKILREEGIVTKAQEQSGIINMRVKDWAVLQ